MTIYEPLKIANGNLAATRQIEHCPPRMMTRELTMNAIEASSQDASGNGFIVFGAITDIRCGDAKKLFIWNNGPGMTPHELKSVMDLSSTINKSFGLHGNFGIGAKVSTLFSNKLGFRMWSCRNGVVSEAILAKPEGCDDYSRIIFEFDDGTTSPVRDVTEEMAEIGQTFSKLNNMPKHLNIFDTSKDWTAVTLFGNHPSQDTVINPFGGVEKQTSWLPSALYRRFWSIPENVSIYLTSLVITRDANRNFTPISKRLDKFTKHEVVSVDGGIKIHYLYDAKIIGAQGAAYLQSYAGALCHVSSFGCIVYNGEMYDYSGDSDWVYNAKYFGIPFGYKNLSVAIELPDDFEVFNARAMPNSYRTAIIYGHNKEDIKAKDFSHIVIENRPKWFLDVIDENAPSNTVSGDIRKQLQALLDELMLKEKSLKKDKAGDTPAIEGHKGLGGGGTSPVVPGPDPLPSNKFGLDFNMSGKMRAVLSVNNMTAPKPEILMDDDQIREKGIEFKAAAFDEVSNLLFINGKYEALNSICDDLAVRHANHPDQELLINMARNKSQDIMSLLVGRVVVFAKAKHKKSANWTEADIEKALSPESLTMAADAWATMMTPYHQEMSRFFKIVVAA